MTSIPIEEFAAAKKSGEEDAKGMVKVFKTMKNRKACPPWSVHGDLYKLGMVLPLHLKKILKPEEYADLAECAEQIRWFLQEVCCTIRLTKSSVPQWQLSQTVKLMKPNKEGCFQ